MTADPRVLARAMKLARRLAERRRERPIDAVRWLPLQLRFLRDPSKAKQIRTGNQGIGKTWPMLALMIGHCVGRHPLGDGGYAVQPPPVEWWLVCASESQSIPIQGKLHELLPKDEIDWSATTFSKAKGFGPVNGPVVVFKNGSIIRVKTTGQDALDFAGATLNGIGFDEPPRSLRLFVEALQRLEENGGHLLLSYTPVNADTAFLQELVASGQIVDHHARLEPEQLIPEGATAPIRTKDGRPKDAAWIATRLAKTPASEREVVIHGEYDAGVRGAWFDGAWDASKMVVDLVPSEGDKFVLGIDHGDRPGKQYAVLMAVDDSGDEPVIHVLDEYSDETGRASPADDARLILEMLARHKVPWHRLSFVGGDRVHMQGHAQQKSNQDLSVHVARRLKVRMLRPIIVTIKRGEGHGAGAPKHGARFLWLAMSGGRFTVHPRCKKLIAAIPKFILKPGDDQWKDPIDGVRYGLDRYIFRNFRPAGGGPQLAVA